MPHALRLPTRLATCVAARRLPVVNTVQMSKSAFIAFALVLWVTPAVLAGMFGWPGIWGSGSAFGDLIVPAPITGGIFHVPTFVAALVIARLYPGLSDAATAFLRASLIAAALVGLAQLINLERLYLHLTTDLEASAFRLHRNYFGLCLMTDAAVSWLWLSALRRPTLRWPFKLSIALLPPLAAATMILATSPRLGEDFLHGRPGHLQQRGDSTFWVYTRLSPDAPGFRAAALAYVDDWRPERRANTQDLAVYFTDSLHTAREYDPDGEPLATLCLYEDGTPSSWHSGRGDCFTHHENFHERIDRLFDELPAELPRDVRNYRVALEVCSGHEVPEQYSDNEADNYCRYARLDEKYRLLVETHGAEALGPMLADGAGNTPANTSPDN